MVTQEKRLPIRIQKPALTQKEQHLITVLQNIPYGHVSIFMKEGQPVRVEKITESFEL